MVSSAQLIATSSRRSCSDYEAKHIVVDPVMVATSGAELLRDDAVETLKDRAAAPGRGADPQHSGGGDPRPAWPSQTTAGHGGRRTESSARRYGCAVLCKGGHQINDADDLSLAERRRQVVPGQAHRQPQHPRHRLHPFQRHCLQPGQGLSTWIRPWSGPRPISPARWRAMLDLGKGIRPHEPRL